MKKISQSFVVRTLVVGFLFGTIGQLVATDAEARAGRGRSMGRSSSFGSRQAPPQQNPSSAPNQFNAPGASPNQAMNSNRGGFMRNMAGGIAGGFLGSMLFSSIGNAAGLGGGAGGGIGILEIVLFAGLAYFGFRWWKARQQTAAFAGQTGASYRMQTPDHGFQPIPRPTNDLSGSFRALAPAGIDGETASDIFFKVQGAWTRRDLSAIANLLGLEVKDDFERDIRALKDNKEFNRLENISIRRTEVLQSWDEGSDELSTVRFTANLLDYTVSETTGQLTAGSDTDPVKFAEDWTFRKTAASDRWQLVGIQQV